MPASKTAHQCLWIGQEASMTCWLPGAELTPLASAATGAAALVQPAV
jgi:hypothetical protein